MGQIHLFYIFFYNFELMDINELYQIEYQIKHTYGRIYSPVFLFATTVYYCIDYK